MSKSNYKLQFNYLNKRTETCSFYIVLFFNMIYNKYEKYNWLYTKGEDNMKEKFVGIAKVGEKGQIVIPKEARDMFDINPGDSIIVLCDNLKGIALLKADEIEDMADKVFPKGEK